jgi:hypothetical protein
MSFTIAWNCWQGPHATVCPQPAEADIRRSEGDSRFDAVADIGRIEIPQCSGLLPYRGVLFFSFGKQGGTGQ